MELREGRKKGAEKTQLGYFLILFSWRKKVKERLQVSELIFTFKKVIKFAVYYFGSGLLERMH